MNCIAHGQQASVNVVSLFEGFITHFHSFGMAIKVVVSLDGLTNRVAVVWEGVSGGV